MKLATNIHHVSWNCRKGFQGQRSSVNAMRRHTCCRFEPRLRALLVTPVVYSLCEAVSTRPVASPTIYSSLFARSAAREKNKNAKNATMGHWGTCPLNFNNFIFSSHWSKKSDSLLSTYMYCVVCEISCCRCQQLTALSTRTALHVVTKLLVIEQLLHPALKSAVSAPWPTFQLCPSSQPRRLATNPLVVTANALFFVLLSFPSFPCLTKFVLPSHLWKQVRSNWNFNTVCSMALISPPPQKKIQKTLQRDGLHTAVTWS